MIKKALYIFIILLFTGACSNSGNTMAGGVIAGPGAVVVASRVNDQPIEFNEFQSNEVLRIEFKDREFIESQITDKIKIQEVVSQIKQSSLVVPVQGDYYRTVELVLVDGRVVRIGINGAFLKNGSAYYQMGEDLNEEIKKHF